MDDNKKITNTCLPLLPLRGLTIFPGMLLHFDAARDKSINALDAAMKGDRLLFLVAQRDIRSDDPSADDVCTIGTVSRVRQILRLPGSGARVLVEGICRACVTGIRDNGSYMEAELCYPDEKNSRTSQIRVEALMRRMREVFEEYVSLAPAMTNEIVAAVISASDPGYLADFITQNIQADFAAKQTILEEFDPVKRLKMTISLLLHENEILKIKHGISEKVHSQMDENQKDYFLREQLRAIQEELGEDLDYSAETDEYRGKILSLSLAADIESKLLKEVDRLSKMQPMSPESGVIRTYLDECLALPWNVTTHDRINIAQARKILDADHYGLEKVKERILEFLAVNALSDGQGSQILCLVGPPGTGKTSIASSVAKAMGRCFGRLSLGGVHDEADIRGHRKTYIGAMPGRIMTAMAQAGSKNCVILMDEIDKLGTDMRGDPSSALLEVFDTEQNSSFRDHYLEIPFDLSQVLFITTANTLDTIPRPLLDRMEIIDIPGYTDIEKMMIAKNHLIAKEVKRHGLNRSKLRIKDEALRLIISDYTRESGVRELERRIAELCRKAALTFAEDSSVKSLTVNEKNLIKLLGNPKYKRDEREKTDIIGVVNGLAWTAAGGEMLEVEAGAVPGSGKLELTGNLGDVMKESVKAALTYIRSRASLLGINEDFYKTTDMHIHFPEGATPKDGPSAGITAACALVSALTSRPVRSSVAMTGEITLRGRVLPIGGLRQKTMAAYRAGIKTVIIPKDNLPDLDEIDPVVREGLSFVPVDDMDTVLREALGAPVSLTGNSQKPPKADITNAETQTITPSPAIPATSLKQ